MRFKLARLTNRNWFNLHVSLENQITINHHSCCTVSKQAFLMQPCHPWCWSKSPKKNPENSMDVGCWDTVLHVPNGFPMGFPLGKHCSPMSFPPARPAMTTPPITETMIPRRATKAAPCARPSPRLLAMRMPTLSPMAMENRKAKISTVIT